MNPALLALCALSIAGACAAAPRAPREPLLLGKSASIAAAADVAADVAIDVMLEIENPNRAPLTLRAVDWELALDDDTPLARGRSELDQPLPGRATTPITARLTLGAGRAALVRQALAAGGELYLDGILHFGNDVALPFAVTPSVTPSAAR